MDSLIEQIRYHKVATTFAQDSLLLDAALRYIEYLELNYNHPNSPGAERWKQAVNNFLQDRVCVG